MINELFKKQVSKVEDFIRLGEKDENNIKIGIEFENIIVDKNSFQSISYYGVNGVESTMRDLCSLGWIPFEKDGYILGLSKDNLNISLEPGSQFEFSIKAEYSICKLESEYLSFLNDIIPIIEKKNQYLLTIGYHPVSKISEIKMIPKERYKYMYEYFKKRGKYAHSMMKGTASTQISIDYISEEDYIKKFRVTNVLSPLVSYIFDNTPIFEGKVWEKNMARVEVWNNCDSDRCMITPGVLDKVFKYKDYAKYIVERPPILASINGKITYTKDKKVYEIYDSEILDNDLNHIMTMFFPDVRTKQYIEIRMADSLPYPYNMSYVAFWKGILYNKSNLDYIYLKTLGINEEQISQLKGKIIENESGITILGQDINNLAYKLVTLSKKGLSKEERKYLKPLEELILRKTTLVKKIKENLPMGIDKAMELCIARNK